MIDVQINKELLPIKAHYFLFNAGTAPVTPFMSTYAKQLGFSSFVVGIIYTVLPAAGMLAKPLMGGIADRFQCQKMIFLMSILVTAVAIVGINFLPSVPQHHKIHFSCDNMEAVLDTCIDGQPTNTNGDHTCALNLLTKEIGQNVPVSCYLSCPLRDQDWAVIHDYWKPDTVVHSNMFKFKVDIPMNLSDTIGDCIYFRVKNIYTPDGLLHKTMCPVNDNATHHISAVCDILCDSYVVNELITQPAVSDEEFFYMYQFWLLLAFFVVCWVGQAVVVSIGDAICFELLGDKPNKYGNQRLYGALGWGIFSIIAGTMVDYFSKGGINKNYQHVFYMAVFVLLINFLVCYTIKVKESRLSVSIIKDVGQILANVRVVVYLIWCVFMGMCTALMWQFLFWHVEDLASQYGCDMTSKTKTIEGAIMAVQTLGGELPFFFLSGYILNRIGHVNAMSLVVLVCGVRFLLYSLITNPWLFLPVELMNGPTFGLFYATMASYASIIAPPGTVATMQGLVGAVFEGVGVSSGSFIGGLLFKWYGGAATFRMFGVSSLIFCLLHVAVQYLLHRGQQRNADEFARYAAPQDALSMVEDDQHDL